MDTIIHLKPSDIISESMDTINYNFDVLANQYDIYDYRLSQLMKELEGKINNNKTLTDEQIAILTNTVDQIDTTGGGEIITSDDVQTLVDNAIRNANEAVSDMIRVTAGEQIRAALGGYAKTSEIKDKYVASTAFTSYTANADAREATVNMFAANSVFYKDQNGYLYDNDNTRLNYTNVKDLFNNGLSSSDKAKIDPEGKGLSDPDVVRRFIEYCEIHLKTVTTEVAGITAHTEEGSANVDIIANVVNDPNDLAGKNLTAAIFVRANREEGSSIVLNADRIKLDSSHRLDMNTGTFTITGDNFSVDEDGFVTANGIDFTAENAQIGPMSYNKSDGNIYFGISQNTWISDDGTLHAKNADIEQNVVAEQFMAESTYTHEIKDGSTIEYSGEITQTTTIMGDLFQIEASGDFINPSDSSDQRNVDGNKLFITILDRISNKDDNGDIVITGAGDYLYGVPALCMKYGNKLYTISPVSWTELNKSTIQTNMRWLQQDNVFNYSIRNTFNSSNSNYYILLQNVRIPGSSTYIKYQDVYMFADTKYGTFIQDSSYTPSPYTYILKIYEDTDKEDLLTQYGLKQNLISAKAVDPIYVGYSESTKTEINSNTCNIFAGYVTKDSSFHIKMSKSYNVSGTLNDSKIINMYNWIKSQFIRNNGENYWKTGYNGYQGSEYNSIITGLESNKYNLPFESGSSTYNITHPSAYLNIEYYPNVYVNSNGEYERREINKMLVKCQLVVSARYELKTSTQYNMLSEVSISGNIIPVQFDPSEVRITLNFDMVMDSDTYKYSAGSYDTTILPEIEEYLRYMDFNQIQNGNQVDCEVLFSGLNIHVNTNYDAPKLNYIKKTIYTKKS